MNLSYYNLPSEVYALIPFVAAGAVAVVAYFIFLALTQQLSRKSDIGRLDAFSAARAGGIANASLEEISIGSFEHRVRLAFASIKIDATGNETFYLMVARIGAGIVAVLVLLLIGLPVLTALSGFLAGYVFVNGWVTHSWNLLRTDMEAEIPSLLTRLGSALQIAPNVPGALEIVGETLKANAPLHAWTLDLAAQMHAEGQPAMDTARKKAAAISPSLSIVTELIARMWQTGGTGYHAAFASAAENLESVLDARVMARAKGGAAQRTANMLVALIVFMIAFMTKGDALNEIAKLPIVQIAYAAIVLVVVFGHSQISKIIDESV